MPSLVVSRDSVSDVVEILKQADVHYEAGRFSDAQVGYERALRFDLNGDYRDRALFGLGSSLDRKAEHSAALRAYEDYLALGARATHEKAVTVRALRLAFYLGDFSKAERLARRIDLVGRTDNEALAIFSARAMGSIQKAQWGEAELEIARGRRILSASGADRAPQVNLDRAALAFAEGELLAQRARDTRLAPDVAQFARDLERRCQFILDAQSAYSEAMQSGDPRYAAQGGIRISALYENLHGELLAMPPPAQAKAASERSLVEAALRLRYSVLLDKAEVMLQHTKELLERSPEASVFRLEVDGLLRRIQAARTEEEEALAKLPYTRAVLEEALKKLSERAREGSLAPKAKPVGPG